MTEPTNRRYSGAQLNLEAEEAEIARLEEERNRSNEDVRIEREVAEAPRQQAGLGEEEDTFKKRYSDLRRYVEKDLKPQFEQRIKALEDQLLTTTQKSGLPAKEEDISAWMQEHPQIAAIVESIAIKRAKEVSKGIEDELSQVRVEKAEAERGKAEAQLKIKHEDLEDLKQSQDFIDWIMDPENPEWVRDSLIKNGTDWRSASRAIDLYKADRGISKSKPKTSSDNRREAARDVNTRQSAPELNGNRRKWKESEVAKLSDREYEKHEEEIEKARRSGDFIFDIQNKRSAAY